MRAIYSIEGNIGSGKSTFLNLLRLHQPKIHVIPQPVAQWQKISNKYNLLEEYYKDPARWAFSFQINAVLSRAKELRKLFQLLQKQKKQNQKYEQKIYFSERSIVADREIFAKLLHNQGKMNQMQYALYINMYDSLEKLFKVPRIHKFIYLRTTPEKCMQRMRKRARSQQNSIKLQYLSKIHQLHEEWLKKQENKLIVNGQQQFQNDQRRMKQILMEVKKFINN